MQEAKIKITADSKDADSQIKKFSASFKSSMEDIEDVAKKAAVGITAISGAVLGVSYAYDQQEKAEFKLRAALIANGRQVDKTMKSYIDFAAEIQALTIVGDETTLQLLQIAESMGLTGESAMRAAKNAIAMQSAFNVASESAIRMTAALEQGESGMLRQVIPALKKIEDDTQRAAMAQDILTKAFDQATAEANTFGGSIIQLKNAFGDVLQVIGEPFAKDLTIAAKSLKEFFTVLQTNPVFIENIKNAKNVLKEFFLFIYDNQKILAGLAGAYLVLGTAVGKYTAAISLAIIGVERLTRAEANFRLLLKLPEKAAIALEYNRLSSAVEEISTKLDELKNRYRELRALPALSMSEKIEVQILQRRIKTLTEYLSNCQEKLKEVGEKVREIDSLKLAKLAEDAQGPFEKAIIDLMDSIKKIGNINIEIPPIKDEEMLKKIKATGTAAAKKFQEGFDFENIDNLISAVVNKFNELNKIAAIDINSQNIISDTTKSEVFAAIEILKLYKEKGLEINQALVDSIVKSVRKGREEISKLTTDTFESIDNLILAVINKFSELNKIAAINIDSQNIISDTTKSEVLAAIEILQLYKENGFEINQALVDSIVESVRKGREEISKLTTDTFESIDNLFFAVVNKFNELNRIAEINIDSKNIISDTTKSEVLAAIEILELYKEKGIEINQALVDSIVESVRKGREEISQLTEQQAEIDKRNFEKANQEKLANQQKFFTSLTSATSSRYKTLFNVIKVAEASIGLVNAYSAAVKALNDPTPLPTWARLANYAAVLGAGLNLINAIHNVSMGGSAGGDIGASGGGSSGSNNLSTLETGNIQRQSNIKIEFNVAGSIVSGEKENFQQLVREIIIPLLQDEANIRVGGLGIA